MANNQAVEDSSTIIPRGTIPPLLLPRERGRALSYFAPGEHTRGPRVSSRGAKYSVLSPKSSVPHAFTLLEIIIVIAVITILAGIFVGSYKAISNSSRTRLTHVALENAKTLMQNYQSEKRNALTAPAGWNAVPAPGSPAMWIWQPSNGGAVTCVPNGAITRPASPDYDFWRVAYDNASIATPFADPLVAPGNVTAEAVVDSLDRNASHQDRYGSVAVINTQLAIQLMATTSANRNLLNSLPNNQKRVPDWAAGAIANGNGGDTVTSADQAMEKLPVGATSGVIGETGTNATFPKNDNQTDNVTYVAGCQVGYRGASGLNFYRCITAPPGSVSSGPGNTNYPPTDTANWVVETNPTPLLLDGWNNPIIFVPASGLRVRINVGTAQEQPTTITSPDHRPFWASAGPDGDFSTGDDNIYSFEQ